MSVSSELKNVTQKDTATGAIYLALIAAALADALPTAADGLYFILEKKLRDDWKKGEITPQMYWRKSAFYYYSLNTAYWLTILGVTASIKGDSSKKLKVALGLVGSGVVLGVIMKNIKKDKKELAEEALQKQELLKHHPEFAQFLEKNGNGNIPEFRNFTAEKQRKELNELKSKNKV